MFEDDEANNRVAQAISLIYHKTVLEKDSGYVSISRSSYGNHLNRWPIHFSMRLRMALHNVRDDPRCITAH